MNQKIIFRFCLSTFIPTSRLLRSDLQRPGPNTETSGYSSHRSYSPVGSAETHAGSGPQCGADDAQPQWNHPERESDPLPPPSARPLFSFHCDRWISSWHPDDRSECGLHPDLQRLCGQPGGVCGHEYKGTQGDFLCFKKS